MPSHLPFFDEAVEIFLEAFALQQSFHAKDPSLRVAAKCIRTLALALEKGCKHALATVDPYLLVANPDRNLLIRLRRDLLARSAPSIFCSRLPFETISLAQCWESLSELRGESIAPDTLNAFTRALRRLITARNRAYHGEVFDEPAELIATVDQVLARFTAVMTKVAPEWLERLGERNGQLLSRLRGIEQEVDGAWQVLVDYLKKHGPIELSQLIYIVLPRESDHLHVLFGQSENKGTSYLSGGSDVPRAMATGIFNLFLTKQQADDRYAVTRRQADRPAEPKAVFFAALAALGGSPQPEKPPIILEAGTLTMQAAAVWLTLHLPSIRPSQLFSGALLPALRIEIAEGDGTKGTVSGLLQCQVVKGSTPPLDVHIRGTAQLAGEMYLEEEPSKAPPQSERTLRHLELTIALSVGAEEASRKTPPVGASNSPEDSGVAE